MAHTINRIDIPIIATFKKSTTNYCTYIRHDVNQGTGAAIQTGIAMATGKYLFVLGAGPEYEPGGFNTLLKPIVPGPEDVVYGSASWAAIRTASCSSGII